MLVSAVEPTAKRGKHDSTVSGNLQSPGTLSIGPYGSSNCLPNTLADAEGKALYSLNVINVDFASNGANPPGAFLQSYETMPDPSVEKCDDAIIASNSNLYANMPLGSSYSQTLAFDRIGGIHLVDFLTIHLFIGTPIGASNHA